VPRKAEREHGPSAESASLMAVDAAIGEFGWHVPVGCERQHQWLALSWLTRGYFALDWRL